MRQVFVLKNGAVISLEGHPKMTQEQAEKYVADLDTKMDKAMAGLDEAMRWLDTGLTGMARGLKKMGDALKS
jgi:hypothetical protein